MSSSITPNLLTCGSRFPLIPIPFSVSLSWILIIYGSQFQQVDGLCGYESCPKTKSGYINVHLVAHSHDDLGWLKTVDDENLKVDSGRGFQKCCQFFRCDKKPSLTPTTKPDIHPGAVQYILDTVVTELKKNPQRKFIFVETGFFWRWFKSQDDETKQLVRSLVLNGQLEFTSGGWSLHDNGCTIYSALIDQMTLGLRYLNDTFGECAVPKVGWQIDIFGHSREQAFLFAQMGFDGVFLGRIDYQYRSHLRWDEKMEMLWDGSPTNKLGKAATLFTGILYNYYQPPSGFCFDTLCKDDPINDDPELSNYNVDKKVKDFLRVAKSWESPYGTQNVLMTMGSDFHYMNSVTWFKNLDKLIKYVNAYEYPKNSSATRVNVFYSTPSCYLQEVHRSKKPLPKKTSDFFPYSNDPYGFWSGYFSSRPTFKYYIQKANNFLQVCKQVAIGAFEGRPSESTRKKVWRLSEPMALVQHHDAITGTAKQHVTNDYSKRLHLGIKSCEEVLDKAFRRLHAERSWNPAPFPASPLLLPNASLSSQQLSFEFCHLLNISSCSSSENSQDFLLSVYNPLARDLRHVYIRVPVSSPAWNVKSKLAFIPSETFIIPKSVQKIPGRVSKASYELVFHTDSLPGLALSTFRITENNSSRETVTPVKSSTSPTESSSSENSDRKGDIVIRNSMGVTIVLDEKTGLLKTIGRGSVHLPLKQNFYYYLAMAGNNSRFEWRASGAYIFRPNTSEANGHRPEVIAERPLNFHVYEGAHLTEVHQVFSDWISQVIRLYDKSDVVEFEWLIGPIPVQDGFGKEVITRYSTNMKTNGIFFTDSNGRQLVKRKRNYRDYPFTYYEPVAGNYYPVTSRIILSSSADEEFPKSGPALIVLNDRSQGGTSMNDGEVELLLHRRLLHDDAFGVEEALNEVAYGKGLVARGKHWVLLAGEGTGVPVSKHRAIAQEILMDKILSFSNPSAITTTRPEAMEPVGGNSGGATSPSNNSTLESMHHLSPKMTVLSQLARVLPSNIHLLTVEAVSSSQVLLRLEHVYEREDDDPVNSKPVKIPVRTLIRALPFIKSLRETTLGANQWIEDVKRFEWILKNGTHVDDDDLGNNDNHHGPVNEFGELRLRPMEIKTYLMDLIQ